MQHTFFLISKKSNLHMPHTFCLSLLLFCTTTMLFCRTKTSNFLVTHYFYGGIVICACPIFCLLCSCSLLFFIAAHFHCSDLLYNFHTDGASGVVRWGSPLGILNLGTLIRSHETNFTCGDGTYNYVPIFALCTYIFFIYLTCLFLLNKF